MTKQRSKFNVSANISKRTYNGITFDSELEMRYYKEVVLPLYSNKTIIEYELQKKYELQPSFKHNGVTIRAITYVADFYLKYDDGHVEVIDTKGFADPSAKLKKKLFWYKYPNIDYKWIAYSKIDGGWCDYEVIQKNRQKRKRAKK